MCLSLEHQYPSKTSKKIGYFDRVTVSSHILYTANQETEGSQDRLTVYILQDCLLLLLFYRSYALFKSPGQKKVFKIVWTGKKLTLGSLEAIKCKFLAGLKKEHASSGWRLADLLT